MGRETNKQRRERNAASAREKAAIARAEQHRADQRRRAMGVLGTIVAVAIVGVLIAIIAVNSGGSQSNDRVAAAPAVVSDVTSVTPASLQQIGKGTATLSAKPVTGQPALTSNGKPEVLYIGGEFCPYCAAERWSLLQALSRFGSFSGLSEIRSATTDGNLATFSFYKSTYTSKYVSFVPVENQDRNHKQLEPVTSAQRALWAKYGSTGGQLGFPFLYFGGKYYQSAAGYDYTDLSGKTQAQIAAALKDPSSKLAQDILGEANNLTATICKLTDNAPAKVCTAPQITAIQGQLGA